MRVVLFFGSFNPLHWGHIAIANYVLDNYDITQFQFVLSPQNPLKNIDDLEDAQKRLKELSDRVESKFHDERVVVSDVEFHLPKPLFTINTLQYLKDHYPENEYILLIGADNLAIIERWHRWRDILSGFEVWVYPRLPYDLESLVTKYDSMGQGWRISAIEAPTYDISSTEIRDSAAGTVPQR